jgi:UDP-2,3-diacylglucosamine pyrophosphatase LpxH
MAMKPPGGTSGSRLQPTTPRTENLARPQPAGWWCVREEPGEPPPRDGGTSRTIVISDIHIGTNAKTCWYQKAVHEPYLASLFDYIVAHAAGVTDPVTRLVMLGDIFDFWTYPPDQRPPTIDDIIKANERILGDDGKLSRAVHALDGNVIYLRGNHDIGLTQDDLDRLPLGKYTIPLVDDLIVDESGLVLTHGHLFTMFNAPDDRYPGEVPVGHFVTRAIAHMLETTLPAGYNAADLANQGSPYGFSLESFVPALLAEVAGPSITSLMLDYFAARCGLPESAPITMADGSKITIRQVKKKYNGLWDRWVSRYGGGVVGETIAAKAVKADYNGDYMAWFAQKAAWDHAARGAVTGHTHMPKQGIDNSTCLYVNCGFACPAVPDVTAGSGEFSFAIIDREGNPALWCVVARDGTYCVGPCEHTEADQLVYAPFSDFSCYVTIANNTDEDLERVTESIDNGFYVTHPPDTIAAGATARFWLQDLLGLHGAEGGATYAPSGEGNQLKFVYGCPTGFFQNYASGGSSFVANSGNPPSPSQPSNSVPPYGHPLFVDFRVDGVTTGVQPWTPRSLLALAVDAAGFLYDPGQDIIYSKMYPLQRDFGYAYGYDAAALAMNAIIDCEPIFFDYAGKTWMIELWKGQYGLETGCEIGVYNRTIGSTSFVYGILDATIGKRTHDPNPSHNLFFDSASDSELLSMSSTLYRKGQKVFSRGPERHWWLTGFKWGLLSEPGDLTMDVSIECLDGVMKSALVGALTGMGYQNVKTKGNTVSFTFDTPKTPQPRNDYPQLVSVVRAANQQIVSAYNSLGLTSNDPNTVGDQAAATIGRSFAIYGEEFFANVIANLAQIYGIGLSDAIRAFTDGFSMALEAASQFVTNAGYTFASWIQGIGDVINEALDFSCLIEISNRGSPYELVRESYGVGHGNWAVEPPQRIPAGGVGRFWLKDPKPSPYGSDGWVRYGYVDSSGVRQSVRFDFNDPTGFASNEAKSSSSAFSFYTKSGNVNSLWSARNVVFMGGHPFYVAFVWGNAPLPSDA